MIQEKDGVYEGIPGGIYHAEQMVALKDMVVSKSMLWDFFKNPKLWAKGVKKTVSSSMEFGSLVDCLTLTPEEFGDNYIIQPETYMGPESQKKGAPLIEKPWNNNATVCAEWGKKIPKHISIVSAEEYKRATRIRDSLKEHPIFGEILSSCKKQVAVYNTFNPDKYNLRGLPLRFKCLIDALPVNNKNYDNAIVDLKTTSKIISPKQLKHVIYDFGYHVQAKSYLDAYNAVTGENRTRFIFAFVTNTDPIVVATVEVNEEMLAHGRDWMHRAVDKWTECVTTESFTTEWDTLIKLD